MSKEEMYKSLDKYYDTKGALEAFIKLTEQNFIDVGIPPLFVGFILTTQDFISSHLKTHATESNQTEGQT